MSLVRMMLGFCSLLIKLVVNAENSGKDEMWNHVILRLLPLKFDAPVLDDASLQRCSIFQQLGNSTKLLDKRLKIKNFMRYRMKMVSTFKALQLRAYSSILPPKLIKRGYLLAILAPHGALKHRSSVMILNKKIC
jgi:hypothetical protein